MDHRQASQEAHRLAIVLQGIGVTDIIYTMSRKTLVWIGLGVGSTVGSLIPALWGGSALISISSIFFSGVGGILGIWAGWKAADYFG